MKLRYLLLSLALVLTSACAQKAPPNLTPPAVAAYNNARIQKALDLIRDTVDDGTKTTPPLFTHELDVQVATWHESLIVTLHAGLGWKGKLLAGLDELQKNLPPPERDRLLPYVTLAKTIVNEVSK